MSNKFLERLILDQLKTHNWVQKIYIIFNKYNINQFIET